MQGGGGHEPPKGGGVGGGDGRWAGSCWVVVGMHHPNAAIGLQQEEHPHPPSLLHQCRLLRNPVSLVWSGLVWEPANIE